MAERVTVAEAAERLGISEGAVRQRLNRGTLSSEKDVDGRVYILLGNDTTDGIQNVQGLSVLVESLHDQVQYLREQLDEEKEAHREADRENRRLLAAALERIPAIEAPREEPSEPRESAVSDSEDTAKGDIPQDQADSEIKRSWWQRLFGVSASE